jgi:ubiquinone/menaquinone biosynthesis C-methylase UbiE
MPPARDVPESVLATMRADWNRRAREDAYYYVGFAHPDQDTAVFQATAAPIVPMLEAEFPRLASPPSASKALEVGCGPGRLMLPLSRHFAEIHGVDVSDEMIARARELLQQTPNAHPHTGTGADLRMFPDASFDFVYSYAVFQHIPSKEVVLNYLREIQRVLKPLGVFRGQFHGAPQAENPDTWAGCFFTENEIAAFAAQRGLQLLALAGEGTQYLWATFRKLSPPASPDVSNVKLLAVTAASGAPTVPQRGAQAAVSLWIAGLPDGPDLNHLSVSFNAAPPVRGCYLSPVGEAGGCQLNAILPKSIPPGQAKVVLHHHGKPLSESSIEVTPGPAPAPRVVVVTDAINRLSESRIECGTLKAILDDVGDPGGVAFEIDGRPAPASHRVCLNPLSDQHYYTVPLPFGTRPGRRILQIRASNMDLPPVHLEIV